MRREELLLLQYGPKINEKFQILPIKVCFDINEEMLKSFDDEGYHIEVQDYNKGNFVKHLISATKVRTFFINPNETKIPVRPGLLTKPQDLKEISQHPDPNDNTVNHLRFTINIIINNNTTIKGEMITLTPLTSGQVLCPLLEYCYTETALQEFKKHYIAL